MSFERHALVNMLQRINNFERDILESPTQIRLEIILAVAVQRPDSPMSNIYLRVKATEVAVRTQLKRLLDEGLIVTRTGRSDKRTRYVSFTPKGRRLLDSYLDFVSVEVSRTEIPKTGPSGLAFYSC